MKAIVLFVVSAIASLAQTPGSVMTIAGSGVPGYSTASRAIDGMLDGSYSVAVDSFGNLYFADSWNHRIRKVTPSGALTVLAGTGVGGFSGDGGNAASARLNYPRGVAVDAQGTIYVSDSGNSRIRQILPSGVISTFAGTGNPGFSGDGGNATAAQLRQPRGIAVDRTGNVYVADSANFRVRRIAPNGTITTVAGRGEFGNEAAVTRATSASIGMPYGIAVNDGGDLLFADPYNHVIRKVIPAGEMSVVAGTGTRGFSGDGGDARAARLNQPRGVGVDTLGNVYVADTGNNRIRRIASNGAISTVIGSGVQGFAGDSGPASTARLNSPYGVAMDPRGNTFFTDLYNYRIRKARLEQLTEPPQVTTGGVVSAADFVSSPSPGGLMSVFGTGFGYNQEAASRLPLATVMGGTSVSVNGVLAPIIFRSATQINAQVPWSTAAGLASVRVNFGGVESDTIMVQTPAAIPAAFVLDDRRGIVLNQDGSINAPDRSAPRGSVVTLYATGLGRVNPATTDGVPAPTSQLSVTATSTTVRFGNVAGTVQFSGLTPGFVGLWQVNVLVPANAPTGGAVLSEIQVGSSISRTFTVSIRAAE